MFVVVVVVVVGYELLMHILLASSYINSGFSTAKSQSNPEASHDLAKSQSADQLRKLSDSELTGSGRKNDVLKGSGYALFDAACLFVTLTL